MEWTDERMDDLAARMDAGFGRTDRDIRELSARMDAGFARVDDDFRALRQDVKGDIAELRALLMSFGIALIVGLVGVIATLAGVVATGIVGA